MLPSGVSKPLVKGEEASLEAGVSSHLRISGVYRRGSGGERALLKIVLEEA